MIEEDNSPEALQAELVEELLAEAEFRANLWPKIECVSAEVAREIVGKALAHATAEWLMRMGEKPPVDTPAPH